MKIRNIDKTNDWTFGQGSNNYVRGAYAVAIDIKMKLQEWTQDCFFNLPAGIPWDVRLGSKNQKYLLDVDILRISRSVEGVLNIFNFESSVDVQTRRYRCSFNVYQAYSTELLPINFEFSI